MDTNYLTRFRSVLRRFERALFFQNSESCCAGITLAQCHTLLEIEEKEKISVSELAQNLALDKSTISRTVDGLVRNGYVNREIPPDNRRTTALSLTQTGTATCCDINTTNNQFLAESLLHLTRDEQEQLLELLTKLTRGMANKKGCRSQSGS